MFTELVSLDDLKCAVPLLDLCSHADFAAAVFAALGVIYGVFLAQVVVASWSDFEDTRVAAEREAAALIDLVRLAEAFELGELKAFKSEAANYARTVSSHEWSEMASGTSVHEVCRPGDAILDNLLNLLAHSNPGTPNSDAFLSASLAELDELGDAREARFTAYQSHLPYFMWCVLLVGGALAIFMTLLFDVDNEGARSWLLVTLLLFAGLMFWSIWAWDHPFRAPAGIKPNGFERALIRIESQ
jgi:hypothetical protein